MLGAHNRCFFETIIHMMQLLCGLFWLLYSWFQSSKLWFGSVFIAEIPLLGGKISSTSSLIVHSTNRPQQVCPDQRLSNICDYSSCSSLRIRVLDVCKPTSSNGWTKLIALELQYLDEPENNENHSYNAYNAYNFIYDHDHPSGSRTVASHWIDAFAFSSSNAKPCHGTALVGIHSKNVDPVWCARRTWIWRWVGHTVTVVYT